MEVKTIYEISSSHIEDSWLHRWETRTKLATFIVLILGLIYIKTPLLLLLFILCLLLITVSVNYPAKKLIKKTSIVLSFLLLMSLPILLGGGLPISQDRFQFSSLLVLRGLSSIIIMQLLFYSESITSLFNGLGHLKLPTSIISILFLSWRYIYYLFEILLQLNRSLKSRLFKPSFKIASFKIYGQIIGGVLVKSIDASEKIYRAMISRSYNGNVYISHPKEIKITDILKSSFCLSVIVILHIIERLWF